MDKKDLLKLIEDDDLGILNIKPKQTETSSDDRLLSSFQEINNFVKINGREPNIEGDINEHQLFFRLKTIREDKEKIKILLNVDEFSLLSKEIKAIKSIADIFADDDLGIFDIDENSIFNLKYVSKERAEADFIAKRKPCKNFADFEEKFIKCHQEIKDNKRKLLPFHRDYEMEKGMFFVLKGMLVYLAEVGEKIKDDRGKWDTRLRAIFENGTESNLLLRSLGKALFKDGRRVSKSSENYLNNFYNVTSEDQETGYIYVVKSLSNKQEIKSIKNLYKIGFSKIPVEERLKNAVLEPTYLMATVEIIAIFRCFNMNPQKFEQLLHQFFGSACLNIDIFDNEGRRHSPREWFIAPLRIIEQAIDLIINGKIVNYKYNPEKEEIIFKD
ncbi:MAG: GIY-YIG nuclease family protein [Rickettsiales bacterium]|nr:GIY-YIG nuclease family protein [Rickettsiales bacterium]